jgi:xylulokinase
VGAAITVSAGLKGEDVPELAKKLIRVDRTYDPDPKLEPVYRRNYEVFKRLYRSNKRNFRDLNS